MTSLFDQYEQAAARSAGYISIQKCGAPQITTAGYINARSEEENPIFTKQRISFRPTDVITHLVACNNLLVLSMKNQMLLRIDILQNDNPDEIDISKCLSDKSNVQIYDLFQDPSGRHLIISMCHDDGSPLECFYLSRNAKKLKTMTKVKGKLITAVAWNFDFAKSSESNSSGAILVGTSTGNIYETELGYGDERFMFNSNAEQYWKWVYELKDPDSITGIHFHKYSPNSNRYFILVCTPSRFYQFVGSVNSSGDTPIFQNVFKAYTSSERFMDIPHPLKFSKLFFNFPKGSTMPQSFGWLTGPGIFCGDIDVSGKAGEDSVTTNARYLYYNKDSSDNPISALVTEFHALVLFSSKLKVISLLNEEVVYEDMYSENFGKMVGITRDPLKSTIWAFSEKAVYKYKVFKEDRNVWEIYLDKGNYELAKFYCKGHPENLDMVISKQAEKLFDSKNYEECASLYAKTRTSFEEVALKFMEISESEALMMFIMKKLESLKQHDQTQITMLVTWLIELYLNKLGMLRDAGQQNEEKYTTMQDTFRKFLGEPKIKECIGNNKSAVYDLMSSHGNQEDLVFFAIQMRDFEKVIRYHVQHGNSRSALMVLTRQNNVNLFYQFSPSLIQSIPKLTVDSWVALGRKLNPTMLIPALVQYSNPTSPSKMNEAIRYLRFCIYDLENKDQAIHNYLIAMYARYQTDELMSYLNFQGQDSYNICYDLKYALRLCSEVQHHEACVHIYSTMGLYEEAVDLALKVDVELAKQNANRPEEDEELKKKLWLKIAKHVVSEENDIKKAMEFLQDCHLVKIEDILPFFKDFVTIDHFKDAICASLQEYNEHIEDLKKEMDEATKKAQEIRTEIQSFRNRYAFVQGQDKCSICSFPIMTRPFYLFPCQHLYHTDCLISELIPQVSASKRTKIEEIQHQLSSASIKDDSISINSATPTLSRKDQLNAQLDDFVASECLFCGEMIIKSIDKPFIEAEEFESVMQGWD